MSLLGLGGLVRLGGLFGLRSLLAALRLRLAGRLRLVSRGQIGGKLERGILNVGSGRRCLEVGGRSLDGRLGLGLGSRGSVLNIWLMDRGEASGGIFPPVMKAKPYFLASGAGAG